MATLPRAKKRRTPTPDAAGRELRRDVAGGGPRERERRGERPAHEPRRWRRESSLREDRVVSAAPSNRLGGRFGLPLRWPPGDCQELRQRLTSFSSSRTSVHPSMPREVADRTRIQVFDLAGESSIGAASLSQPWPRGGARRAELAGALSLADAALRRTKGTFALAASSSRGRESTEVPKCAALAPSPKVDQLQGVTWAARGNGGEARTPGDPSTPPRDVSPAELESRAPVVAFAAWSDRPPKRRRINARRRRRPIRIRRSRSTPRW